MNNLIHMAFHRHARVSRRGFAESKRNASAVLVAIAQFYHFILPTALSKEDGRKLGFFPSLVDEKQYFTLVLICISLILKKFSFCELSLPSLSNFHIYFLKLKLFLSEYYMQIVIGVK